MNRQLLVSCSDLVVDYGDFRALSNVELRFGCEGVTGLIGVNGAGKTTLIHALTGLNPRSAGDLAVLKEHNVMGYCPDTPSFEPWLSAPEVLEQSMALTRQPIATADEIAATLTTVGLGDVGARRVGGFSRGMKQRLGVAAALVLKPKLLFLDEPTSALDPVGREEMLHLIRALGREIHIVFSSHLLDDVERVAQSLVVIHQGSVLYEGSTAGFLSRTKPSVDVLSRDSAQLRQDLEDAGIEWSSEGDAGRLSVEPSEKAGLFAVLARDASNVEAVLVERTSLQVAFQAEIANRNLTTVGRAGSHE